MDHDLEEGWPCQRIRLALGAMMFLAVELSLGPRLPPLLLYLVFGLGLAAAASAMLALETWKLQSRRFAIEHAIARRPRR